jgi:hypothetical protein
MDADERDIVTYLKTWSGQYVSAREIARRAASKKRFQQEPNWAVPVLGRLVEKGIIESDSMAHYRLLAESKKHKPKRWLSPEIKKILEQTGKEFSEGAEISEPEDPDENKRGA